MTDEICSPSAQPQQKDLSHRQIMKTQTDTSSNECRTYYLIVDDGIIILPGITLKHWYCSEYQWTLIHAGDNMCSWSHFNVWFCLWSRIFLDTDLNCVTPWRHFLWWRKHNLEHASALHRMNITARMSGQIFNDQTTETVSIRHTWKKQMLWPVW